MNKIVLCDIDGTVANNDHRQHYLEGKKDWDGFFSELINDRPIPEIINQIKEHHSSGKKIIFLTGRPEKYRKQTLLWLLEYFDFELNLLMRKNKDQRNKLIIKKEIFELNFDVKDIFLIFENDEELISMWKDFGANVFDINKSDY
tara:strand:+ start:157 stop:591 length:435 start_codon:yes stop_codon:yes gene_type:complete